MPQMVEPEKHRILYDDECWMCTFQMRMLTWLDWCDVARLSPVSDPATLQLVPGLNRQDLLEAIHCVSREGAVLRGARALRFIGLRMPLLVPMALSLLLLMHLLRAVKHHPKAAKLPRKEMLRLEAMELQQR